MHLFQSGFWLFSKSLHVIQDKKASLACCLSLLWLKSRATKNTYTVFGFCIGTWSSCVSAAGSHCCRSNRERKHTKDYHHSSPVCLLAWKNMRLCLLWRPLIEKENILTIVLALSLRFMKICMRVFVFYNLYKFTPVFFALLFHNRYLIACVF